MTETSGDDMIEFDASRGTGQIAALLRLGDTEHRTA
jgi:hypothetical protein